MNGWKAWQAAFAGSACAVLVMVSGCSAGLGVDTPYLRTGVRQESLRGVVHGGNQAITGATIQLYAVGSAGNASAATPLIGATVTTSDGSGLNNANANAGNAFNTLAPGNFTITGGYTCPAGALVYMTATGGNPGLAAGTNNTAIANMAALGFCATLRSNAATTFININEVTTVAGVYALGGFASDVASVGYSSGNLAGITSAFATGSVLASTASGSAPGVIAPAGVTLPVALVNSLADSVSACVNSVSGTSTGCAALFAATTVNGTVPGNTMAALANMVHNPSMNVTAIINLAPSTPPFQPVLSTAPADLTMSIQYTGGGLNLPGGVALDGTGNAWVANEGSNAVTVLATGAFVSGSSGYVSSAIVGAQGIAVDASGNVWLANTGADNVLQLNASGAVTRALSSGISGPVAVALDGTGNVWVANFDGNSVAEFTSAGAVASGSPFTNAALAGPTGLAIDANNNVWVGNSVNGSVAEFNSNGVYQNSFSDGFLLAPGGVATDSAHSRVWAAGTGTGALTGITLAGSPAAGGPFGGGGVSQPLGIAVDGAGTAWVANNVMAGSVSAFTPAGVALTPAAGLGVLNQPVGVAVDGSGNVWVTSAGDNSVTQMVGVAAPTVTPLVSSGR